LRRVESACGAVEKRFAQLRKVESACGAVEKG
jgi:hypothetical protein